MTDDPHQPGPDDDAAGKRMRRRRSLTAGGVALAVATIVVGGTILGRPHAAGIAAAISGAIPLCPTYTTARLATPEGGAAGWGAGSMEPPLSYLPASGPGVPQPAPTSFSNVPPESAPGAPPSSVGNARPTTQAPAATKGPAATQYPDQVTVITSQPAWYTPAKALQLTEALRAALPPGVHTVGGRDLGFGQGWMPAAIIIASADIASPAGQGSLLVSIAQGAPGIPACSDGPIERRIIEPDGTAVDVGTASAFWVFMAGPVSTPPPGTPPIKQTYATAHRRDGAIVKATLTQAQGSPGEPLTLDQLAGLVAGPGLDVSSVPSAAQSSRATGRAGQAVITTASAAPQPSPTR